MNIEQLITDALEDMNHARSLNLSMKLHAMRAFAEDFRVFRQAVDNIDAGQATVQDYELALMHLGEFVYQYQSALPLGSVPPKESQRS